ncbi:hypothetical protein C8F04DRAFT_1116597 [Mycena alexandri]|uniref:Uncharacterized protein n=1 Tax=Mycena alexandri TaxID=1745969 RepID=A0AAD6WXW9_9AGAR|nr:hypothetical protein C8F04DRAFT_1116597 [Mycena alexandri]
MSSFAMGPLPHRPSAYQNQYNLVNQEGYLGPGAICRPPEILGEIFVHVRRGGWISIPSLPHICSAARIANSERLRCPPRNSGARSVSISISKKHTFAGYGCLGRGASHRLCDTWEVESPSHSEGTPLPTIVGLLGQWRSLTIAGDLWANLFESRSLVIFHDIYRHLRSTAAAGSMAPADDSSLRLNRHLLFSRSCGNQPAYCRPP